MNIVKKIAEGGAQGNILPQYIMNYTFPLPTTPAEQHRIAAIIDKKLAAVEKAKKAAEEQMKAAGALVEAFVAEMMNDKSYRKVKISDVCSVNPTTRGKLNDLENDMQVTFVPMPAVSAEMGTIVEPEIKALKEVRKGFTYFENDDVLFAKITPCMQNGKHAIAKDLINGVGFGSTEFHVIKPGRNVMPEWIHYFIRQSKYLHYVENYLQGAVGQQRLPDDILKETLIPLPSMEEQKKKVSTLTVKLDRLNQISNSIQEQSSYINALPAAILRKAFAGEM
jgi:type I restriction enzyme S subunit